MCLVLIGADDNATEVFATNYIYHNLLLSVLNEKLKT